MEFQKNVFEKLKFWSSRTKLESGSGRKNIKFQNLVSEKLKFRSLGTEAEPGPGRKNIKFSKKNELKN